MTINSSGGFDPDTKEVILDSMMIDAKARFGDDLNDDDQAVIRLLYDPPAERFAESQIDISNVLSASQIRNATGSNLDLLAEQVGVSRVPERHATGVVRFSRESAASTDYTIPSGTVVQTTSTDPIEFETTESAKLVAGSLSVDVPVVSVEGGVESNIGINTLTVFKNAPTGIEEVTNPADTDGGAAEETDDELRARINKEVGSGSRASAAALIRGVRRVDGVKSVSIFINDKNVVDADNRPPHSFELVVEGGNPQDVANQISDIKAAGDTSLGGYSGTLVSQTVELPNGQLIPIDYSNPTVRQVYVDVNVTTTDEYAGDVDLMDSIVTYVGGFYNSGNTVGGELGVGDDVLIGEVEYAIRAVPGVYDVNSLTIALDAIPAGTDTNNLVIADSEKPSADATDGSITITK